MPHYTRKNESLPFSSGRKAASQTKKPTPVGFLVYETFSLS